MDCGRHNGLYLSAMACIRSLSPATVIDARWLAARCGLTCKQAYNALHYARRLGVAASVGRGRYTPAHAA